MLNVDSNDSGAAAWMDVGVHPTPPDLVSKFCEFVLSRLKISRSARKNSRLKILDACSGDGRLGHALAARLTALGHNVYVTFVEVSPGWSGRIEREVDYAIKIDTADFFSWRSRQLFDVVISNPPFEALSFEAAVNYGIDWSAARASGRNLYGLAIRKCISLCRPGGDIAVIAPHGWLRNLRYKELRKYVAECSDSIDVLAHSKRNNLFPDVSQEIAFHLLKKSSNSGSSNALKSGSISYDDAESKLISLSSLPAGVHQGDIRVRVGPLVWNRTKLKLISEQKNAVLVVNGGNIGRDGVIQFTNRYRARQYVRFKRLPDFYISRGPAILIKRSMRGSPGAWELDFVFIKSRDFRFVAENHVIVVTFSRRIGAGHRNRLVPRLAAQILAEHSDHGHPNISAELVRVALGKCLAE